MLRYGFYLLLIIVILGGCGSESQDAILRVAVASSVQFAAADLVEEFEDSYDAQVEIISSSSGKLTTQILNGAPFDLFMSANQAYPNLLLKQGKALGKPEVYGYGNLVLWTNIDRINLEEMDLLWNNPDLKKIALADPKNAPYGQAALKFLKDKEIHTLVENKLIYGENVSQLNEYVLGKNVDLAFGAKSIVLSPELKNRGKYRPLESDYHVIHSMVIIKNKNTSKLKQAFFNFVLSEQGKKILGNYGFTF